MKVLGKVLSRWAITMVIIISIYVVIWTYSNKTVMTQTTKRQYNALITGLSIALGLAVASSLNHMVAELRWWILSRRYRSKRKVELILQADNLKHTIALAASDITNQAVKGSQVGLAAIGLCYSTDTADKRALLVPGNVSIANMASIETEKVVKSKTQALAYDTAEISAAPLARAIHVPSDPLMFCTDTVCKYVFYETSTASIKDPDANPVTVATDRSVNSTTKCTAWPVISGGNGTSTNVTVALENNKSWDIFIPNRGGTDQTTFMTYSQFDCGTGCSMIMAFEASDTSPWYYSCNVTIGQVANATRAEHQVGANLTSLASAGIALQGYAASSFVNDTNFQYQMYPSESVFGTPMNGTTSDMEAMLSRFAIGVVAISADSNTNLVIEGTMPMKGTKLNVSHWGMINLILILTASLQLVLGIGVALVANRVVVPDGGAVEMAQVMRTMAIRDRTTSAPSEKGSTGEPRYKSLWIYRDTLVSKEGGLYDLHMEEQRYHATSDSGMIEMSHQRPGTGRESTAPSTPTK
ncbi:uncharacterized protein N0V96_000259 [Colletotrichum fioriniae]|uniref:uncharacterized protein n=1 Tax=Colletotrichum fioriniae TaxID=710243 RepID=UPI0032DBD0D5|nr:hypothetical protein N0V96_000259 [Colletotrichum fioriniae]